jgi:hypothetical protein
MARLGGMSKPWLRPGRVPLPAVVAALMRYWKRDCHTANAIVDNSRVDAGTRGTRRGNGNAEKMEARCQVHRNFCAIAQSVSIRVLSRDNACDCGHPISGMLAEE